MVTKIYWMENTDTLDKALRTLTDIIPCFIKREFVEMNFSRVEIQAREEDLKTVERELASAV